MEKLFSKKVPKRFETHEVTQLLLLIPNMMFFEVKRGLFLQITAKDSQDSFQE